jgi:hypothetical protein
MRDCRTFVKLQEAMELNQGAKPRSTAYDKRIVNQGYPIKSGKPSNIIVTNHHRVPTVVRPDSQVQ